MRRTSVGSLLVLGLWLLGGPAGTAAPGPSAPEAPNVVVILVDDLGYGDLGCYGSTVNLTPNIDRLAREGIRFTDLYVSDSVCSPEIETLRTRTTELPRGPLAEKTNPLSGLDAELLDLELDIIPAGAHHIILTFRGQEVSYDVAKGTLKAFGATVPLLLIDDRLQLRVLLDRTSIEVFGNQGQVDIAGVFFPDPANHDFSLSRKAAPPT